MLARRYRDDDEFSAEFDYTGAADGTAPNDWSIRGGPFVDGAEISRIRARFTKPNVFVKVNVELGAEFNVAFV